MCTYPEACTPCHSLASCPSHSTLACRWHQLLLLHFSANRWSAVMHRLEQCCLHPHDSLRTHCAGRLQLVQQHVRLPYISMIVLVRMQTLQWTVELKLLTSNLYLLVLPNSCRVKVRRFYAERMRSCSEVGRYVDWKS